MGTLYSHPGYNKYDLFCQAAAITITDDNDPIALLANILIQATTNMISFVKRQLLQSLMTMTP